MAKKLCFSLFVVLQRKKSVYIRESPQFWNVGQLSLTASSGGIVSRIVKAARFSTGAASMAKTRADLRC